jgi:hypothetical protein
METAGKCTKKHLGESRNNSALELWNGHLIENEIIIRNLHKEDNRLIKDEFGLNNKQNKYIFSKIFIYSLINLLNRQSFFRAHCFFTQKI